MTNLISGCAVRCRPGHRVRHALPHPEGHGRTRTAPAGDALSDENADCVLAGYAIEAARKSLGDRIA